MTLLIMGGPAEPLAAQDPSAVLAKVDSVQNAFDDMTANQDMILTDRGGDRKERKVRLNQKGSELRMVRFLEPADVRGVGFLRLASDRLYLYLPAFRRVRRIASSAKNENFMGTDFTYEDLSQSTYADDYEAIKLESSPNGLILTLEPRSGAEVSYSRLLLSVDPANYVVQGVDYFESGNPDPVKRLTVEDIQKIDGYWMGRTMQMTDLKEKHSTRIELSDIEFDQGLTDRFFSERNLKRPVR